MAQTPAIYRAKGDKIDYTPVGAVIAGQVIVLGDIIGVAEKDIPAGDVGSLSVKGSWDLPKTSDAFSQGDDVFWNASGNPVVGTAGTGAADNATGVLIGKAADDAAGTDAYVRTVLTSTVINIATVGGSLTADDITGGDSTLTITGKVGSSSAGGLVSVTGGAGKGTTNVGGAGKTVAGERAVSPGGRAGTGAGRAGVAGTGAGGATAIRGGAGTNDNMNGGAVTIRGGAKHGSGTDGAVVIGDANTSSVTSGKEIRVTQIAAYEVGGNAIGNANQLTEGVAIVSNADNEAAVKLPEAIAGGRVTIRNQSSDSILAVFPSVNDTINGGSANAVFEQDPNTLRHYYALNAVAWFTDAEGNA